MICAYLTDRGNEDDEVVSREDVIEDLVEQVFGHVHLISQFSVISASVRT